MGVKKLFSNFSSEEAFKGCYACLKHWKKIEAHSRFEVYLTVIRYMNYH